MKALSMPITSPGRPEKFPPPSKRFSRTGSRSKSSPIFYRRNAAGKFEAAQEPYSPRVTCIGQVRAGKSGGGRRRCWLVKKAMFWGKVFLRLYRWRRGLRRILGKWVVFFRSDYCKRLDAEKDCLSNARKIESLGGKCENLEIRVRGDDSPPRTALSLTRFSRSASLGERIRREKGEESDIRILAPCEDAVAESRIRQDSGSTRNHVEDLEGNYVVLKRCKSEPTRGRKFT